MESPIDNVILAASDVRLKKQKCYSIDLRISILVHLVKYISDFYVINVTIEKQKTQKHHDNYKKIALIRKYINLTHLCCIVIFTKRLKKSSYLL